MCSPIKLASILVLAALAACGSDSKKDKSYPATEDGLVSLISDVVADKYSGDLAKDLMVPDAWLNETFGPQLGARFLTEKQRLAPLFDTLPKAIEAQTKRGRTEISAKKFDAESDDATTLQNYLIKAMKKRSPIFSVYMREKGKPHGGQHFYSWVHVDGKWRFLSKGLPVLKLDRLPADPMKRAFLESSKNTRDRILGGKKGEAK